MAKMRITEYDVVGGGTFPVDMLRYDASYPAREADQIFERDRGLLPDPDAGPGLRRVRLHHRDVYAGWHPTYDRWQSFGWLVDRTTERNWTV